MLPKVPFGRTFQRQSTAGKVPWPSRFLGRQGSWRQLLAIRPSSPCRSRLVIIDAVLRQSGRVSLGSTTMGITDHRKCAEECVAMARLADAESDKALWLTLAQSWVRLAEHVARAESRAMASETSEEIVG
jgi:hypothetical protein